MNIILKITTMDLLLLKICHYVCYFFMIKKSNRRQICLTKLIKTQTNLKLNNIRTINSKFT